MCRILHRESTPQSSAGTSRHEDGPTPHDGPQEKLCVNNSNPYSDDRGKTLIEQMFGGKLQTTICCLNCKSTSQKQEAFTDLSLAFPPCPGQVLETVQPQIAPGSEHAGPHCQAVVGPIAETLPSCQGEFVGQGPEDLREEHPLQSMGSPDCPQASNDNLVPVHGEGAVERSHQTMSVPGLINYFLAPEILNGENKYYCETCGSLQNAQKELQVVDEPEYLILTLLRFSYDAKSHIRRKILDDVVLPLVLQLPVDKLTVPTLPDESQLLVSDSTENVSKKLKSSDSVNSNDPYRVPYLLSSIVVHSGMSSESGHYYCYARNTTSSPGGQLCCQGDLRGLSSPSPACTTHTEPGTSVIWQDTNCREAGKEWFLFNDSRVTFTSFQSVQNVTSRFPKDTAYVLFYRKQDTGHGVHPSAINGVWVNGEPPLQKELMDAITKDNKLYLQEQELNARTRALQASSTTCSFRPHGFDDNDPPGSCGPSGGGGGGGGFNTISRLVF